MLDLHINGMRAVLKEDTNITMQYQSAAWKDTTNFSLAITLPLEGCEENQNIFGFINRLTGLPATTPMDAVLTVSGRTMTGTVTITELNATEVKVQFVEGSVALTDTNNVSFDDIYINELSLYTYDLNALLADFPNSKIYFRVAALYDDDDTDDVRIAEINYFAANLQEYVIGQQRLNDMVGKIVCLPWANRGSGKLYNAISAHRLLLRGGSSATHSYDPGMSGTMWREIGTYHTEPYLKQLSDEDDDPVTYLLSNIGNQDLTNVGRPDFNYMLSPQVYWLFVLERIFAAVGYTLDRSNLNSTRWANLIICNTLPGSYNIREVARVLPHWTVTEFIEQAELLMNGRFNFNTRSRTVSFAFDNSFTSDVFRCDDGAIVSTFSGKQQKTTAKSNYTNNNKVTYNISSDQLPEKAMSCDSFIQMLENLGEGSLTMHKNSSWGDCWARFGVIGYRHLDNTPGDTRAYDQESIEFNRANGQYYLIRQVARNPNENNNTVEFYCVMERLNSMSDGLTDSQRKQATEIKIKPAAIYDACGPNFEADEDKEALTAFCNGRTTRNFGFLIYVSPQTLDGTTPGVSTVSNTWGYNALKETSDGIATFYNDIQVAFWNDGFMSRYATVWAAETNKKYRAQPHPVIDTDDFLCGYQYTEHVSAYDLGLASRNAAQETAAIVIDETIEYTFTLLLDLLSAECVPALQTLSATSNDRKQIVLIIRGQEYVVKSAKFEYSMNQEPATVEVVVYKVN